MSEKLSEMLAVVGTVDPAVRSATGTVATDAIDMSKVHQVAFVVLVGAMGATDEIDFKVQECATSGGSYTDISGKAITTLDGTDDNKQAVVNVRGDELTPGNRYIKGLVTHGGTAGTAGITVVALADTARFKPASDGDLASVAEIVG